MFVYNELTNMFLIDFIGYVITFFVIPLIFTKLLWTNHKIYDSSIIYQLLIILIFKNKNINQFSLLGKINNVEKRNDEGQGWEG